MTDIIEALREIKVGEAICYWTGELARNCDGHATPGYFEPADPDAERAVPRLIRDEAYKLWPMRAHLVQEAVAEIKVTRTVNKERRRVTIHIWRYYAIGR